MKIQRLLIALTIANLALLILSLAQHPVQAQSVAPVLRGRAFEIVDDHGRVRASISVLPADPNVKMPDGTTGYPEAVLSGPVVFEYSAWYPEAVLSGPVVFEYSAW